MPQVIFATIYRSCHHEVAPTFMTTLGKTREENEAARIKLIEFLKANQSFATQPLDDDYLPQEFAATSEVILSKQMQDRVYTFNFVVDYFRCRQESLNELLPLCEDLNDGIYEENSNDIRSQILVKKITLS